MQLAPPLAFCPAPYVSSPSGLLLIPDETRMGSYAPCLCKDQTGHLPGPMWLFQRRGNLRHGAGGSLPQSRKLSNPKPENELELERQKGWGQGENEAISHSISKSSKATSNPRTHPILYLLSIYHISTLCFQPPTEVGCELFLSPSRA